MLSFEAVARRLYESNLVPVYGPVRMASNDTIERLIREAMTRESFTAFSERFLCAEWHQIVDAAQLRTWEGCRDYSRVGRRSRLREPQRQALWSVFASVIEAMEDRREMTPAEMFTRFAKHYDEGAAPPLRLRGLGRGAEH